MLIFQDKMADRKRKLADAEQEQKFAEGAKDLVRMRKKYCKEV